MKFEVCSTDGRARAGILTTDHGIVETPMFMPVGTRATVKAVEQRELIEIGAHIILGNTYHLYLRPGTDVIEQAGGLHRFMNWYKPILTDSGGFQVFSLSDLREISPQGVRFQSHLDGSYHFFTPSKVIAIQRSLGSDIMMVLDECTPYPCEFEYAQQSNEQTIQWAYESKEAFAKQPPLYDHSQALFGIVQGSVYPEIRIRSAVELVKLDFDGYAIGGLAVGEPTETLYSIVDVTEPYLPANKPRYLMGVGLPENILEAIERGIDMFDCVIPTRNGRNGMLFTNHGILNIKNARYKYDFTPIQEGCPCYACQNFTRAYIRHLFLLKEIFALQLASIHNLTFFLYLVHEARNAILQHRFQQWKQQILENLKVQQETNINERSYE
ncbi:MAG: tRNA guanosine(34) transglycosylase Tgt [Bacteroidetes bacterium]|nr:tRNA guanosine(34) transglycosylase Tgt [Bacteroidota bacterium]